MIGYYIHHHGRGHLVRAQAIADALGEPVTGLSSLPRPAHWRGPWVTLARDDDPPHARADAHGRVHWAPVGNAGLRGRMAAVSAWIADARPAAVVVDVSVEIGLLVRLHGVPVVAVAVPGERADAAHALGFDIADAILGAWPADAPRVVHGLSDAAARRVHAVGAIARYAPAEIDPPASRDVLVLAGAGGDGFTPGIVAAARAATPEWTWRHIGGAGTWVEDPWPLLLAARVVVTHAGENALAEVAAARRPAIVLPQPRPHAEQTTTARALAQWQLPAVVRPRTPGPAEWPDLLARAAALDGSGWARWNDGDGARRAASVIRSVAEG